MGGQLQALADGLDFGGAFLDALLQPGVQLGVGNCPPGITGEELIAFVNNDEAVGAAGPEVPAPRRQD